MATIAAALIVAGGAAYAASAAAGSAEDQQAMIEAQMIEAARIRKENRAIAEDTFGNINSLIDDLPGLKAFLPEGKEIADYARKDRTDYILGSTEPDLRKAQSINTALGAFDFSGAGSEFAKILQGNLFDIASITKDSPSGAFANLSVQNMAGLAQQGLGNAINIGDYLGRISGVDQFNPYRVAQDLFQVELGRSNSKIQALNNRAAQITEVNTNWFNNFSDLSQASMVVEANKTNAQIAAVGQATSAIAGAVGGIPERQAIGAQTDYYKSLIKGYGSKPVSYSGSNIPSRGVSERPPGL